MAGRRMLTASVAVDRRFNSLSVEAGLVFLMTIPHLDRDGIILAGDGGVVLWAKVCPLRPALLPQISGIIKEWEDARDHESGLGLAIAYEVPDGIALWFPGFSKNQSLRYKREGKSSFPPPPGYTRDDENGLVPITKAEVPPLPMPPQAPAGAGHPGRKPARPKANGDAPLDPSEEQLPEHQAVFAALVRVCKVDAKLQRGKLNGITKTLREAGYHAADVDIFHDWWTIAWWQGLRGQAPELGAVVAKIKQALEWDLAGRPATAETNGKSGGGMQEAIRRREGGQIGQRQ